MRIHIRDYYTRELLFFSDSHEVLKDAYYWLKSNNSLLHRKSVGRKGETWFVFVNSNLASLQA